MASCLRAIHFGLYFVDLTGARALGMPPAAFSRNEAMSDKLHAVMNNPFFLIQAPEQVPCCTIENPVSILEKYIK